jgi:release factor glutamine methyltransferase
LRGEPLQYILGEWEFYARMFEVGEGVLIPRAETETVIDTLLRYADKAEPYTILDLCAGSGAIGITAALELPRSRVHCIEKYTAAYDYLARNTARLHAINATPLLADIFDYPDTTPDIILTNPPYLTSAEMSALQTEVTHEPTTALYGSSDEWSKNSNSDGLDFYKRIFAQYTPRFMLLAETGDNQADTVAELANRAYNKGNDYTVNILTDLDGNKRVVSVIKKIGGSNG